MISKQQWYSIGTVRPPTGPSDSSVQSTAPLDLSEFPALANRGRQEVLPASTSTVPVVSLPSMPSMPNMPSMPSVTSSGLVARPTYGVVSKPSEPPPDFSIHNEDFPALPGFKGGEWSGACVHFCASLLHISVVTKLVSVVSALNSRKRIMRKLGR